ncbi:ribosome biogenesis GTPase YqeH [Alteribacillus iranensis]|uniref:CP-type G domain-containing protein n=1 Tax=Alteribacillus iranensis TaxID=930128 RepID=A0A1I1Z9A9_9BACI|nr:ribosome biogenesis GTPase YqeH [Alteribacillus iranensis]SFE28279.1 hypothetical protein SAMN05192532_101110 [Alteribacillus iranensis]
MNETIVCSGCGTEIQTENKEGAGYTPPSALNRETVICQRCFRLKHYNEVQDVPLDNKDFTNKLHKLGQRDVLVVKVVDLFDFEGSWIPGFQRYVGNNDVLILANKVDLLPKSTNHSKLKRWIAREAKEHGLRTESIMLISASKNQGIQEAAAAIDKIRDGRDVYVTGCTNVGKSTFINKIIQNVSGEDQSIITTSHFPGTTLDMINIPLDDGSNLYDTPGIINNKQIAHFVSKKELQQVTPAKEIKPRIFQLNEGQSLFVGALARFDFKQGSSNSFVGYFSNELPIHRTKLENADELYEKHSGELLSPPGPETLKTMPPLIKHEFTIKKPKTDIVIAGLGWLSVTESGAEVTVYLPKGVGVSIREAII